MFTGSPLELSGRLPIHLPEVMAGEFPEVKDYFRYYKAISLPVRTSKNEIIRENGFGFADSTDFQATGTEIPLGYMGLLPN
jgi:hypothetical protein